MTSYGQPARSGRKLRGRTEPRLWTPPLRPLNRKTSLGYECDDFMQITGEPFLPWQRWAAIHALELMPGGQFRFRIVLIIVARQNGKSHLKRGVSVWRMYMQPNSRILGVAQEVTLAREQWQMCQDAIHATPDLEAEWGRVRNVNGDEMFWAGPGSRYKIGAANRKAGRGQSNDEVNIDELREQRDWKAWAALSKTTMARPNSQIWCMSNAGDDGSVVLNQLREAALAGRDPSIGIFEWSAEDDCELDDPKAWAQANPSLGYTISEDAIRSSMLTDPPAVFRTEVLCQRVDSLDAAVDPAAWDNCADAGGVLDLRRGKVTACLDIAPDGAHATLAIAMGLPDGRVRVAIAGAWDSTEACRTELPALLDKIRPRALGWYPAGPAGALATLIRQRQGQQEITGGKACEACEELADLVRGGRVVHPGDALLDAQVRGAGKLKSGDGWRFTRSGGGHVDAAYAAAGAVKLALDVPEKRSSIRIIS